jgi:hypothetical protein
MEGVYLYIESSVPTLQGFNAILESNLFFPTPSYGLCMDFWYHMYGAGMGSLNVYINVSNISTLLWTLNGNKGDMWYNGQLSIKSSKSFRIMIEAVRGVNFTSDMAIDDIDFLEKSCILLPENADPINQITVPIITTTKSLRPVSQLDCTFEMGYCIWSPSLESTYNWTRVQGKLGTVLAGPIDYDNSYGVSEAWYLNVITNGKNLNDIARIQSESISETKCMEFYYYLSTNSRFKLNIYAKRGMNLGNSLWSRHSSLGNYWKLGRLTIQSASSNPVIVIFEMTSTENGVTTDKYGIDDVYFINGNCVDSSDVNKLCSFSIGETCGYQVNSTSDFQWKFFFPTDNQGPIPIGDHTNEGGTGSGYAYVQIQGFKTNESTSLISQLYDPFINTSLIGTKRCLEFYYYLRGDDAAAFNVLALTPPFSFKYTLWSRNYDHGLNWWKGEVNIQLISAYKIVFEAIVKNMRLNGIIGLDDVILKNGGCSR